MEEQINRCRLILTANASLVQAKDIILACTSGDIASVILYSGGLAAHDFEAYCKSVTPDIQSNATAVLIADDTQAFGKSGADGLFLEKQKPELEAMIARFSPQNIVGCGNIKARHHALEMGEFKPDFLFFGKLGGDIKDEAHPKNIALAEWWAELIEIPGIVMGGSTLQSIVEVSQTGIDFVALEKAVFENGDVAQNVQTANKLLDEHAPDLIIEEA